MLANSLNEPLLVLVQPSRVGIKGCEHEYTSGRDERKMGRVNAGGTHHATIHAKMVYEKMAGCASLT
jgi:hypothetical protein